MLDFNDNMFLKEDKFHIKILFQRKVVFYLKLKTLFKSIESIDYYGK